jgi:hypothetical protein
MNPIFEMLGTASLSSSSRFPISASSPSLQNPVTLPPGRAMLTASPSIIGSWFCVTRMGIVRVALCAAKAPGVDPAMITAGLIATNSAARSGKRPGIPSENRSSIAMLRPSR